jgi:V/A-type H+-transporting ATPase subunit F
MKAFLISDNVDTQVGMRLSGIKGTVVHEREEVLRELDAACSDKEVGIILITERLEALVKEKIVQLKLNMDIPLIVVIPDRHGTTRGRDSITKYVKESIGLKI